MIKYNLLLLLYTNIEIANAPSFVKSIADTHVEENFPAEFSVDVKGVPKPKVEWSHNGVVIKDGVNNLVRILIFKIYKNTLIK